MDFTITDKSGNRIKEVADSVFAYSLREAMLSLCRLKKIKDIPKANGSEELFIKFNEIPSTNSEKLIALYEAEADAPTRHIFMAYFGNTPNFKTNETEKVLAEKISDHYLHYRYLDKRYFEKGYVTAIFDHKWIYDYRKEITASSSKKRRWEEVSEPRRHSIIVRFDLKNKFLIIGYPGFQRGGEKYLTGGVVYEALCKTTLKILEEEFSISTQTLNLREVIKHISGRSTPKFSVDMLDSRYKQLELFLRKGAGERSIIEDISEALAFYLESDLKTVFGAFQQVIAQSKVDEAELNWNGLSTKTIIRFLSIGPELRFSWERKFSGLPAQLRIAKLLAELSAFSGSSHSQDFWKYIADMASGEICDLVSIQQQTGLSPEQSKTALMTSIEMGLLIPVYKINTDKVFIDYNNDWKEKITDLKKKFYLNDSTVINGGDIQNVLIGFKKTEPKGDR